MAATLWNIDNKSYHADVSMVGSTGLKCILESPKDYYDRYVACTRANVQTPDMLLGSVVHCLVLEPENFDTLYTFRPDGIDGRTTDGKKKLAAWRASVVGKEEITQDCYDKAKAMADAVLAEPTLQELLGSCTRVVREQAIVWEEDGVQLKCKPDWLLVFDDDTDLCLDLKTAADPSPRHWFAPTGFSPMHSLRYDLQIGAHYPTGVEAYTGKPCLSGVVVVGKSEPHDVYVLNVSAYRMIGEAWRQRALALLRQCHTTGIWRDERQAIVNQPRTVLREGVATVDVPLYLYPEPL